MRRLTLVIFILALFPASVAAQFAPVSVPTLPVVGYQQASAAAVHLTALWRAIPAQDRAPVITNSASAWRWVDLLLPWYEQIGVIATPLRPSAIAFQYWPTDDDYALHVLGTTGFCSDSVTMNERLITPGDPWAQSDLALTTLAHELAHVQGVCGGDTLYNDEQSAQLVSWDVLAAMTNDGYAAARVALIGDLRDRAIGMAEQVALQTGHAAEWARTAATLCDGTECARWAQSDRNWASQPDELLRILTNYYTQPMSAWLLACANGRTAVDGVVLPVNLGLPGKALDISDLCYIWDHA